MLRPFTAVIVDHDPQVLSTLHSIDEGANCRVSAYRRFETRATSCVEGHPISALVANVRLGEFNGIHLVSRSAKSPIPSHVGLRPVARGGALSARARCTSR